LISEIRPISPIIGEVNGFSMCVQDIGSIKLLTKPYKKTAYVTGPDFGEFS
jgi:hypothetical protein